jgi:hypothetical protein
MTNNKFSARFAELNANGLEIAKAIPEVYNDSVGDHYSNLVLNWTVKAKHLIAVACGEDSDHYREFEKTDAMRRILGPRSRIGPLVAILAAARDDFDGGYFSKLRTLVESELFDSELDQARELLEKGYKVAASVIAGTVLETALRTLCDHNQIQPTMTGKMNDELAKKGVYNALMHKRILSLAQLRNYAAHGRPNEFSDADVRTMIADVERFLADYLT